MEKDIDYISVENVSYESSEVSEVKGKEELEDMITKFLREKDIDDEFINRLIFDGLTDDVVSILRAMDFDERDLQCLGAMWNELQELKASLSAANVKVPTESDYLREHFGHLLPTAIREIILKKPFDPVEYLANWLLHYKYCQERDARLEECEKAALAQRAWMAQQDGSSMGEFPFVIPTGYEQVEEEEEADNKSYGHSSDISYLSHIEIEETETLTTKRKKCKSQ